VFDSGTPHVLLLTVAAVTTAGLAGYAWRHRDQPGARYFALAMAGVTIWNVTDVLAMTQTGASHLFWERVQWFAIAVVPPLLFLFMAEFTGYGEYLSRRVIALLFLIPALSFALVWTNPAHELLWSNPELIATGGIVTLDQQFGPWFWVQVAFAYTLLLVGFLLLLRLVVLSDYLYFDQSVLIVLGILAPLVGNALGIADLTPLPGLDLTTYGFTITGVAFGNAIFRYRLFDLLPATRQLGRQAALAALDDGIVIVGDDQKILYLNDAAGDIFDRSQGDLFGEPVEILLSTDELDFDSEDAFAELPIGDRTYEVTTAPITDQHERLIGHTILLHDVTSRERRERMLRRQRDELAQLEQINRVVRSVNSALVSATTREEIAHDVCETLVTSGPYQAACLDPGRSSQDAAVGLRIDDDDTHQLDPDEVLPESVSLATSADGTDLATAEETTLATHQAGRGWLTLPLVHGRTVYGTLAVQTERETAFSQRERDVLSELGETIGHAIHAVEQRQVLVTDGAVELEFRSTDPEALLVALSQAGPCTLDGLVPAREGALIAFLSVTDGTVEDIERAVTDGGEIRSIDANGSTAVEVLLTGGSLCCPLVEYGARVKSAEATDGTCQLVVEVAPDSDVQTLVDRITDAFPATTLQARREVPADDETRGLPGQHLADLTDRQREALEAAYRAGYFNWPRDSTAEEVAESLDIASPTLHSHLRKAENRLLSEFFED
jgi:predicted DNA binding protein/PAS domain-containing protein